MTSRDIWRRRWPAIAVGAIVATYAVAFAAMSAQRHRAFWTARFDLGNMVQAVWSAAHGGLLISTDGAGEQISRLGGHVDPILVLFAPLWWIWPSPHLLLVTQALIVSTAAIPAYLLGRLWIGRAGPSVAFAAITLLVPATQWATLFDFHPVTLALPLLLWAIWAAAVRRNVLFIVMIVLACATKEHVGLAVMFLGIWMTFALGRRRAGPVTALGGLMWSVISVAVIIPAFASGSGTSIAEDRYGPLGSSPGGLVKTIVTDPVLVIQTISTHDRMWFVLALLVPLAGLSLLSPLLALGALPELALNLLSSRPEQHSIEYHYGAVMVPFLAAAAIDGYGKITRRYPCAPAVRWGPVALVGVAVASGWHWGPLPFWQHVPGGSIVRAEQFSLPADRAALREAVAMIPQDAVVSAGNRIGGHLSARRRILTFPRVDDAEWVIVDRNRPDIGHDVKSQEHRKALDDLLESGAFTVRYERDGVLVLQRTAG